MKWKWKKKHSQRIEYWKIKMRSSNTFSLNPWGFCDILKMITKITLYIQKIFENSLKLSYVFYLYFRLALYKRVSKPTNSSLIQKLNENYLGEYVTYSNFSMFLGFRSFLKAFCLPMRQQSMRWLPIRVFLFLHFNIPNPLNVDSSYIFPGDGVF